MLQPSPAGAPVPNMSAPAANPNARLYRGRFAVVERLSDDTWLYRITLEGPEAAGFTFIPGQFVQLKANADEKARSRAYSVASAPSALPTLDFCIKHYPDGLLSRYLATVKVGDPALLRAPFGRFMLDVSAALPTPTQYVFVATGTGIAPVRSMLRSLYAAQPNAKVRLYQGAREPKGHFFADEFKQLAHAHPTFSYTCTCSQPPSGWKGETQYVNELLARDGIALDAHYYLCGNPSMVRDVSVLLQTKGVPLEQIKVEKW